MPCRVLTRNPVTLLVITIALAALVLLHAPYFNGPEHWQWEWRRLPAWKWYPLMLLAAAPIVAGIALHARSRRAAIPISLLMVGAFAMKIAAVFALPAPSGLRFIAEVVDSPEATSYYTDAAVLSNYPGWLAMYEQVLPETGLHTRSKPPGPLLYWSAMIWSFGFNDRAAIIGGILQGLLATASIPATWWLAKLLTGDRDAAFRAAAMLTLCPGFIFFFPMFDPIYITLACALIGTWHLATTRDGARWSITFGFVLFGATFISYPLLSLGFFLLLHGLLNTGHRFTKSLLVTLRQGLIALAVLVVVYILLWSLTGFDPIASFKSAWHNQHRFLAQHESDRVWPWTIAWDLWDFALGAAWLPVILALLLLARVMREDAARHDRLLIILCLAQPVVVALTGLVQSETARVWAFMLPLLLLPASLELKRWDNVARLTFFACLWLLLAVIGQNMTFVNPGLSQ